MPHFIVNSSDIKEGFVEVSKNSDKELFHHLTNVLRIKTGEDIKFLAPGGFVNFCKVIEVTKDILKAKILETKKSFRKLDLPLYVGICVIKNEAMASSLKKATELGVAGIIPLISDNCAVKRDLPLSKTDKFEKIIKEAVQQCERADIPKLFPAVSFEEFLAVRDFENILVFSERERNLTIGKYFEKFPYNGERTAVIFGPEGGFSDKEFGLFEEKHIPELTLGRLILRADTALTAGLFGIISETGSFCNV